MECGNLALRNIPVSLADCMGTSQEEHMGEGPRILHMSCFDTRTDRYNIRDEWISRGLDMKEKNLLVLVPRCI